MAACTPYPKLRTGLLSLMLQKLLAFASSCDLGLEASPAALAAVMAMGSLLKREDCGAELSSVLFREDAAPALWVMGHMLRLLKLKRTEEPLMVQEFALLTGRLALFVPAVLAPSTLERLEELVLSFSRQANGTLRLRGYRLLGDLPLSPAWRFSEQFLTQLSIDKEENSSVRSAFCAALPGLQLAGLEVAPLLRPLLHDSSGAVRTAAAQALGAMAQRQEEAHWLLPLLTDAAADVRSACAAALASFAAFLSKELRDEVAQRLLPLCSDGSDKARASALRAVGCLAELELSEKLTEELADVLPLALRPSKQLFLRCDAVQKPPPKCQWSACRSCGQLAKCASEEVLRKLSEALCQEAKSENLKVRSPSECISSSFFFLIRLESGLNTS